MNCRGVLWLLGLVLAGEASAQEVCPLSDEKHQAMMKRYHELIDQFGAKAQFEEFDPHVPQKRLGEGLYRGVRLLPEIGRAPDYLFPRRPYIWKHGTAEAPGLESDGVGIHIVVGPVSAKVDADAKRVLFYENEALRYYLDYRHDRFSVGKGLGPAKVLSAREAMERCRRYLRIMAGRDLAWAELVALEGPFYDEPTANYSYLPLRCARGGGCWPQWDVRFWRRKQGVLSSEFVASCLFDAVMGPTVMNVKAGFDEKLPDVKPALSEKRARELAMAVSESLAPYMRLPKSEFAAPDLKSLRLVFLKPRESSFFADRLVKTVKGLPRDVKFVRYTGTPLVWEALYEVRPIVPSQPGLFQMWVDIDAATGNLLFANAMRVE